MKISLLAETLDFDLQCYQTLILKVLNDIFNFKDVTFSQTDSSLFIGSKGKLIKRLDQKIDILAENTHELDVIFVFVDCDNLTPHDQIREIKKKLDLIQHFSKHKVIIGLPKRNIEAWLLSDTYRILGLSKKNIPSFNKVEEISDPKGEFRGIWKTNSGNVKYETFAKKIINNMDLKNVISNSETFVIFLQDMKSKLNEYDLKPNTEFIKLIEFKSSKKNK